MQAISLDVIDCRILDVLQKDGRISNLELANRIALSPSACLRRLRALEEHGVIANYRAHLDRKVLGIEIEAFVQVSMRNDQEDWHEQFVDKLGDWPEVVNAYMVTGGPHYLLRVIASSFSNYSDFIANRLYKASGVMDITSYVVMQTLKEGDGVPASLLSMR